MGAWFQYCFWPLDGLEDWSLWRRRLRLGEDGAGRLGLQPLGMFLDYPLARRSPHGEVSIPLHRWSPLLLDVCPRGDEPLVYSAIYNGSYILPEMAISCFILYLLDGRGLLIRS